jgi:hypothetical protein
MAIGRHEAKIEELVAEGNTAQSEAAANKDALLLFDRCSSTHIETPQESMVSPSFYLAPPGPRTCSLSLTRWHVLASSRSLARSPPSSLSLSLSLAFPPSRATSGYLGENP